VATNTLDASDLAAALRLALALSLPPCFVSMSKLYAGFLVIASMLVLSGLGLLGLVLITRLINLLQAPMRVYLFLLVYFLVCVGGHYLVAYSMYFMRWLVSLDTDPSHDWMSFLIGFTERAVALTLIVWAPRYLVTFIGGWVLLKFAIGWQRTPLNAMVARGSLLALIGNVLSFAVAIAGGLYLNQDARGYFGNLTPT
jgi:hypothetical protein